MYIKYMEKASFDASRKNYCFKDIYFGKLQSLIHILPTPSDYLLQELTNLFYSFLWDNKADKINRKQICCNYNDGGLKMVNIKAYIISQKLSWIPRLINNNNALWIQYLRIFLKIPYLFSTGSQWSNIQSKRIKNPFWRDVVGCWSSFIDRSVSFTKNAEMTLPIWDNYFLRITYVFPSGYQRELFILQT